MVSCCRQETNPAGHIESFSEIEDVSPGTRIAIYPHLTPSEGDDPMIVKMMEAALDPTVGTLVRVDHDTITIHNDELGEYSFGHTAVSRVELLPDEPPPANAIPKPPPHTNTSEQGGAHQPATRRESKPR